MNSDYDRELEAAISRELKGLPELNAPSGLMAQVLSRIQQPPALPWYQQPWDCWPAATKALSFAMLLAMFGGLCFGLWQLPPAGALETASQWLGERFAGFNVLGDTLRVLAEAGLLVVRKLGPGFVVACAMVSTFSYFACIGIGTVIVRYARARH
jgi:hypothetical protein